MKGRRSKHLNVDAGNCSGEKYCEELSPGLKLLREPGEPEKYQTDSKTNGAVRICATPPSALIEPLKQARVCTSTVVSPIHSTSDLPPLPPPPLFPESGLLSTVEC